MIRRKVDDRLLGCVAVYVVLVGVASFIESPVGARIGAFQLNILIRVGSLAAGVAALLAVHGLALPSGPAALAGLGIGLITVLLSTIALRQPLTRARGGAIALTLAGVTLLALSAG